MGAFTLCLRSLWTRQFCPFYYVNWTFSMRNRCHILCGATFCANEKLSLACLRKFQKTQKKEFSILKKKWNSRIGILKLNLRIPNFIFWTPNSIFRKSTFVFAKKFFISRKRNSEIEFSGIFANTPLPCPFADSFQKY